MSTRTDVQEQKLSAAPPAKSAAGFALRRFARQFAQSPVSFAVALPDGGEQRFGPSAPTLRIHLKNSRAVRAIASLDQGRFGDAYLAGDIDLEGDMLSLFALRNSLICGARCTNSSAAASTATA